MKIAAAVLTNQPDHLRKARMLLACADRLPPGEREVWCLGKTLLPESGELPAHCVCHGAPEGDEPASPEEWMPLLHRLTAERGPDVLLFYGDLSGGELAVRMGILAGGGVLTNVTDLSLRDGELTAERSAYANNLTAAFRLTGKPCVLSLAKGAFDPAEGRGAPELVRYVQALPPPAWRCSCQAQPEEQEESLESAEFIVVGGRGMGSRENMERLGQLAAAMGAKLGGTRPPVLDAWIRHKYQIGASGSAVHPKVCLAMGASGAGPFIAGVEKSGVLAAVNSDPAALIFKYCDVGIVDDCVAVMEALEEIIKEKGAESGHGRA